MNDEYLDFAKELAKDVAVVMKRYFRAQDSSPEWKKINDPVTIADKTINAQVIEKIKKAFPGHGILGEEESFEADEEHLWIVDPIDGMIPYILGLPLSTFLIALLIDGRPQVAVAYNPWIDLMYHSQLGEGAFCNGKRLVMQEPQTKFVELIIWDGSPFKDELGDAKERFENAGFSPQNFAGGHSRYGVAENKLYGVVYAGHDPWDAAVLDLLVSEAGGKITDMDGKILDFRKEIRGAVAGSQESYEEVMRILKG